MAVYLVRISENKELVGLFWSNSIAGLGWAIDECCNPYACDYKVLNDGGVFWSGKLEITLPLKKDLDLSINDDFSDFYDFAKKKLSNFTLSEQIYSAIFDDNGWRKWNVPQDKFYLSSIG